MRLGTSLDDADGYIRYTIDSRLFAAEDPADYARFIAHVEVFTQLDPQAPELGIVPTLAPGEIGIAIQHEGEQVVRAVIVSPELDIHVRYP